MRARERERQPEKEATRESAVRGNQIERQRVKLSLSHSLTGHFSCLLVASKEEE